MADSPLKDLTGKAFVFWDLDNKIPCRGVSVRACIESVRSLLLRDCKSVELVNIYANTATLGCAVGKIEGSNVEDDLGGTESDDAPVPLACPVCGKALKGSVWSRRNKLRRHLEMHRAEQKKRDMMRACIGRNMRSNQRESFRHWDGKFIDGREAILKLINGMDSVKLHARQSRAARTIQDLTGARMRPVPPSPQAADEELVYDLMYNIRSCSKAGTVCLISDDGGFVQHIRRAYESGWRVVVVSQRQTMLNLDFIQQGVPWSRLMEDARVVPKPKQGASPDVFFRIPENWERRKM